MNDNARSSTLVLLVTHAKHLPPHQDPSGGQTTIMSSFSADGKHSASTWTETAGSEPLSVPPHLNHSKNGKPTNMDAGPGQAEGGDRRAKSSSPLSQYDEDAKDQQQEDDDADDMDIEMEIDDEDDEMPVDQISESTVQPRATPSKNNSNPSGAPDEDDDDEDLDELDEDDERQSSVTSSTIPLTSLDDSPNNRHRLGQGRSTVPHGAVPATLGVSDRSNLPSKADIIGTALGESSTLSSIVEARPVYSANDLLAGDSDLSDDGLSDDSGSVGEEEDGEEEEDDMDEAEDEEHGPEA